MDIFTLWLGSTNIICRSCIKSWIRLKYRPIIYLDFKNIDPFFLLIADLIDMRDYREILDTSPSDILLHFTDYFRFTRLYQQGGIWLDADMFLLNHIPCNKDIIISSERTQQSGAFKSKKEYIANIGVLKFPRYDPFLYKVIQKIDKSKSQSMKIQKNMFIFQKTLYNEFPEYLEFISQPRDYCPVNYNNIIELYFKDQFISKYSQEVTNHNDILENSIGVHLWENLSLNKYNITQKKIESQSLFYKLLMLVDNIND